MNQNTLKSLCLTSLANRISETPPEIKEMIVSETDLIISNKIKEEFYEQLKVLPIIMKSIALDVFLNRFDIYEYQTRFKSIDPMILDSAINSGFTIIDELKALDFSFHQSELMSYESDSNESDHTYISNNNSDDFYDS